ncbi:MAG: hypothetical protein DRP74_07185 [Candidatus Omnitrophota bacterium]|nr:MAG: hypothetical protein DRP74_07185 [Candidatus Omnitrophota bacterium]
MKRKNVMLACMIILIVFILVIVGMIFKEQIRTKNKIYIVRAQTIKAFECLKEDRNKEAVTIFDNILDNFKDIKRSTAIAQLYKGIAYMRMAKCHMCGLPIDMSEGEIARWAKEAIQAFEVAIEENRNSPAVYAMALYEMGCTYYYVLDEKEKGCQMWEKLIKTYPRAAFSLLAKFELGQISAEELIKTSERIKTPELGMIRKQGIYWAIAGRYQKEGDFEKAKEYCRKAMEASGDPKEIIYVWAERKLKKLEELGE